MEPEVYFLRFAYPCAEALVHMGRIDDEKLKELERCVLTDHPASRKELENIFESAFRRLKRLSKEMGKDSWDMEVLKKYWEKEHNKFIDSGEEGHPESGETFKDFCRVHVAKVVRKKPKETLLVRYDNEEQVVLDTLVRNINLEVGDKVRIHRGYAIEKVND